MLYYYTKFNYAQSIAHPKIIIKIDRHLDGVVRAARFVCLLNDVSVDFWRTQSEWRRVLLDGH